MENYETYFKTLYNDKLGHEHHLTVNSGLDKSMEIIYHCVIDGHKTIKIQMVDDKWKDLAMKDNALAEHIGLLIETFSE